MSEANKAIVRRWFEEVWSQGREETIDELFAIGGIGYGLGDTDVPTRGPAEFKLFANNLRGAIPDIHMTIEDIMAEGDRLTVRITVEGTHKGNQLGVAATGRRIRIAGVVIIRIEHAQIVEGWNSWDQLGLLRQIGAIPVAGNPDRFTSAKA
jgi:predicted ester cyclase